MTRSLNISHEGITLCRDTASFTLIENELELAGYFTLAMVYNS